MLPRACWPRSTISRLPSIVSSALALLGQEKANHGNTVPPLCRAGCPSTERGGVWPAGSTQQGPAGGGDFRDHDERADRVARLAPRPWVHACSDGIDRSVLEAGVAGAG